jgi:hypothetical protein
MSINLLTAWLGFLLGCLAGAIVGLFFHQPDWCGGYSSWRRRMIRLAHIAFFGIGFLNLSYALTVGLLGPWAASRTVSWLLILGAVAMPAVCYLAAWRTPFRHLFFIPAGAVTTAIILFVWRILTA